MSDDDPRIAYLRERLAADEKVALEARPHEHLATRDNGTLTVIYDDAYRTCQVTSGRVLRQVDWTRSLLGLLQADGQDPDNAVRRMWVNELLDGLVGIYRP